MKVKNREEPFFGIAYWKKRWVAVPFFLLPPEARKQDGRIMRFEFVPTDGQKIEPLIQRENNALEKVLVSETIVPWLWSESAIKQLCRKNNIPLAWVTDRFPRKKYATKESVNRREHRKIQPLTSQEFKRVRKQLVKLNEQASLIARVLWYLNQVLKKGGGVVTLEEVLRMQIHDVSPESEDDSNWIRLQRTGMNSVHLVVLCLPPQLWKALCRQINEKSLFVFSKKNGQPLLTEQIDSYLRKAGRLAGLKVIVTSMSLKPLFNKRQVEHSAKKRRCDASFTSYLEPISRDEWLVICKQIPAIVERKGRKAVRDPHDLFNAMLHIEKTQCSLRTLPSDFPPWSAIESQRRRWKKSGIFEAVIALRKQKSEI